MRSRILEIAAAVVGIAIVLFIYLDRSQSGSPPEPAPVQMPATGPVFDEAAPAPDRTSAPEAPAPVVARPAESPPEPESAEIGEALVALESARAEVEVVETALGVLDQRFDAKEAELAEREAQGLDPEALEEEMLIFLDGIVEEYGELETRLAEAEAAELAASERVIRLRGGRSGPEDPDG